MRVHVVDFDNCFVNRLVNVTIDCINAKLFFQMLQNGTEKVLDEDVYY